MINEFSMPWDEKYRPKTISDCVLPERLKKPFQVFVDKKEIPNLLLSGTAGVGKTTVARAMCEEIGSDYIIINGSDESGIGTLRTKIKDYASAVSLLNSGSKKVIIIDEADYLNQQSTQPAFRGVIDEFQTNCSFIFTCNYKNRILDPIASRCGDPIDFKLTQGEKAKMAAAFMKRIKMILGNEKIEYDDKVVAQIIMKYFPDYRKTLKILQRYSTFGKIDTGVLSVDNIRIQELMKLIADKNFAEIRKWVSTNSDNDVNLIYREIYDNLYDILKKESIPTAVLLLAKYQYQASFCVDQEINLLAFLTELMIECEVK